MSVRIPCAGGIVVDDTGRLLLVRRGRAPGRGLWSVPGGKCLPGEPPAVACVREVAEETGLDVVVQRRAGRVERSAPDGGIFVIDDFVCSVSGGALHPGDDADDARWVDAQQLAGLPMVPLLVETLREWRLLPR
jgi:ADP-ribose pyrophosphatase YjhB (NUDIX family)